MVTRGVNKVMLIGHLGQNPEVRYLPNGGAVANMTLATSETWRDKQSGEVREKTEWHRVTLYGKLAEVAGEYLSKGSQVYIEGQLRTRKWQDTNGQDRYTTEVVVDVSGTLQMLGGRRDSTPSQTDPAPQSAPQQSATPPSEPAGKNTRKGRGKGKSSAAQPEFQPPQGEWPPMDDPIPF